MRYIFLLILALAGGTLTERVAELGREFQELRSQRGHFSGGEWNDALDRFGGAKQRVMLELAQAFGDGSHTIAEIEAVMGAPDEVLGRGDMMFGQAYRGGDSRVRKLIVYYWRGGHDFLYFASDGRVALASGWWAALE